MESVWWLSGKKKSELGSWGVQKRVQVTWCWYAAWRPRAVRQAIMCGSPDWVLF